MKRIATIALLTAFCGSALAGTVNEKLVFPPYPGGGEWKKTTNVDNAQQIFFEWIPAGQPEKGFSDILVEQQFYGMKGFSPARFIRTMFSGVATACGELKVSGPVEHVENGFPIAYAQLYCAPQKSSGQDVDIFVKVISGKEALYVVQREFHRPAQGLPAGTMSFPGGSEAEAKAALDARMVANAWLGSVQLCPLNGSAECPSKPGNNAPETASSAPAAAPAAGDAMDQPGPDDLSSSFGFTPGKTTVAEVEKKLGEPAVRNKNGPGGRFNDMFIPKQGLIVACVFRKDGVLIRTVAYTNK